MDNTARHPRWPGSRVFGLIGAFGMFVFFGSLVINDGDPRWVLLSSGLAMWIGYPLAWYFQRRERKLRDDL